MDTPMCNDIREMVFLWRPYAWQTAAGLWALAMVLITTGVVKENGTLGQVCLAVMILSLVGAAASLFVFYIGKRDRAARGVEEQSTGSPTNNTLESSYLLEGLAP